MKRIPIQPLPDLNAFPIEDHNTRSPRTPNDNSTAGESESVHVYFRNIETHLIREIGKAQAIFGCVAWLTSGPILDALAKKEAVSIVVQKEDFLRPDIGSANTKESWKWWLRQKYGALSCSLTRYDFGNLIGSLSVAGDPELDPIRCVGNYNRDKSPAFPRMHNKFLIFCSLVEPKQTWEDEPAIRPYAVWTGSYNLTKNAGNSLENALHITDSTIVEAYYREFGQIMAISEPLDWERDWVAPEWRIGT